MKTMQIGSLAELPDAAEEIIRSLGGRTIVAFRGEMGAGKTTLIREIAARLGSDDVVTSPTFAIINQYAAAEGRTLYHFDFYRIKKLEEVYDMGYEDYFYSGALCFIEWPELVEAVSP